MKTYTAEELKVILELHKKWLDDEKDGVRADLSYANLRSANLSSADLRSANLRSADLRYADLSYANLSSADLSSANLSSADLRSANLRSADLSYANLSSADLSSADLRYANLRSANLSSADLRYADLIDIKSFFSTIGEMKFVKSVQCEKYMITYTVDTMNIGCQKHSIEEWKIFDDEKIKNMGFGALEWWNKWKPIIMQIIEMSPAEATK